MNKTSDLKFLAMKCSSCGAPVYYDAKKDGFTCAYCSNVMPYEGDDGVAATSFQLDHLPLKIKNGRYLLNQLGEARDMAHGSGWKADSNWQHLIKQKYLHHKKRQNYKTRELLLHPCTNCGVGVEAFTTQNIWNCHYCKNIFIKEDVLNSCAGSVYEVVDNGDELLPHFAVPFSITREAAKRIILQFAAQRPKAFQEQNLDERIDELWAIYVPHRICDSSIVVEIENDNGTALLFQDYVNWVTPITQEHNQHMLMDVEPWDLAKITPFSIKFAEGDISFAKAFETDCPAALATRENTLRPEINAAIKKLYPSKNSRINWIREEARTVKSAMLPIYFLDKMSNGVKVYFMVNGQTGAVCALGRGQMEGKSTLFSPGKIDLNRVHETTLKSGLQTVIEEGPGVYKPVSAADAFRKKGMLKRLLQGFSR